MCKEVISRSAPVREFTPQEVREHNKATDCWITVNGRVYDVTPWLATHPGGPDIVLLYAGDDATDVFTAFHHTRECVSRPPFAPSRRAPPTRRLRRFWMRRRRRWSVRGAVDPRISWEGCVTFALSDRRANATYIRRPPEAAIVNAEAWGRGGL